MLTIPRFSHRDFSKVQVLRLSIIGNPVKIGDGPAAVTLLSFYGPTGRSLKEGTLLARVGHCSILLGWEGC